MTFESLIKKAFFIFLFFAVIRANAEESNITVLMYHRIGDDRYPSTSISKELFEKHIEYLVEENINVLPITELSKYLEKEISLTNKTVFITIDDAYRSFFQNGFPILKKNFAFAFILISIEIIKELPITLILRPFNFETFSTKAFNMASSDLIEGAAIPSLFIILWSSLLIILSIKFFLRDQK